MAEELHLHREPDWEPDYGEPDEKERPRDPVIDEAKETLRRFFDEEPTEVFYQRQLTIIFERTYFHWITARALSELSAEGHIASDTEPLPPTGTITFYRATTHRYWRRQAQEIIELVTQFSEHTFTAGVGAQGEMLFEAALAGAEFKPTGRKVRSYGGRNWTETGHDLDRVFERDGIAYGTEIKNTLPYIPRDEFDVKRRMCKHLGLRPLFIVRMAPKNYINEVWEEGGYTLVFQFQLYPFGQKPFADRVKARLRIPVDCPARIADGTVQRFLNWHVRSLRR
jgi:hypothetical protein